MLKIGAHFGSEEAWERDENCVTTVEEASQLAGETDMQGITKMLQAWAGSLVERNSAICGDEKKRLKEKSKVQWWGHSSPKLLKQIRVLAGN